MDKSHLVVYILFAIPVALAILQVILMVLIFRYDTPNMLKQKGETVKLQQLMTNLYHPYVV